MSGSKITRFRQVSISTVTLCWYYTRHNIMAFSQLPLYSKAAVFSEQTPNICALFKAGAFRYNLGYCRNFGIYGVKTALFHPQNTIKTKQRRSNYTKRDIQR